MNSFDAVCEHILTEAKRTSDEEIIHDFIEARRKGAKRVEEQARAKGGVAELTAIHFAAKQTPYRDALPYADRKTRDSYYSKKVTDLLLKLKGWQSMSQREFQVIMGKIEAWGEIALESKKPKQY